MPKMRLVEPIKHRAWILRYKRATPLDDKLSSKCAVLKSLIWKNAAPEYFPFFLCQLIGLLPPRFDLILALCLKHPDEKRAENTILVALNAWQLLSYLNRIGKYSPKIVYFTPLWTVPSGKIHLLDLTEAELIALIREAEQKQGASERIEAISKVSEGVSLNPNLKIKDPKTHPHYEKILKVQEWMRNAAIATNPGKEKEIKEKINKLFTEMFAAILLANSEALGGKVEKLIPNNFIYESEIRKSLSHIAPHKAFSELAISKLNTIDHNNIMEQAFRKKELSYYSKLPTHQAGKKTTPDHVYSVYKDYIDTIRKIRKISTKYRNEGLVYTAYLRQANMAKISAEEFSTIYQHSEGNDSLAIHLTAEKLHIGLAHCQGLKKEGYKTAIINAKWKDYLEPAIDSIAKKASNLSKK